MRAGAKRTSARTTCSRRANQRAERYRIICFCEKQVGRADPKGRSTRTFATRAARRERKAQREPTFSAIGCSAGLAVCIEAFMKYHSTAGFAFFERQHKKVLLWNAVYNQVRETSEAEPFVVAGISH